MFNSVKIKLSLSKIHRICLELARKECILRIIEKKCKMSNLTTMLEMSCHGSYTFQVGNFGLNLEVEITDMTLKYDSVVPFIFFTQ
jgi:D-mannonate dehydratase